MYKRIFPNKNNVNIAWALNSYGRLCSKMGNSSEAIRYFKESLDMYRRIFRNSPSQSSIQNLSRFPEFKRDTSQ